MKLFLVLVLLPFYGVCQFDSSLNKIPFSEDDIIYEKVFYLDSNSSKDKIFSAIKSVLIKKSEYKYSKIDEDRNSGNITTEIYFDFIAKPGIGKVVFNANSLLSIDVKDDRYRVRLYRNKATVDALGSTVKYIMTESYLDEKKQAESGKWKESKSIVLAWHQKLFSILQVFDVLVEKSLEDDDF